MVTSVPASRLSRQARAVAPFHVMRLLARAGELERAGRTVIHLEVGEPDFPTPAPILDAARQALTHGQVRYTPAAGLPSLRQAVADYYGDRDDLDVSASRILMTPGASGALQLVFLALLEAGDQVILCDPSYPCYRQMLGLMGVEPVALPVGPDTDYQLTVAQAARAWTSRVRAVLVASPANPTGSSIAPDQLAALHQLCRERGAALIVDEIYQGLTYPDTDGAAPERGALALGTSELYVINSFSKYFGMTGWRLGWLVGPEDAVEVMDRIAQNLFIAASTPAQQAALAAFDPATRAILETRRAAFQRRRDRLLPALRELGFAIPRIPTGAFYLYARLPEQLGLDSMTLATRALEEAGVALTPGQDFGHHEAASHVRFAYTRASAELDVAIQRLRTWFAGL
ncbi:aminotransferase [Thiocapsa imhoffii]|uniref:Aminotransferase n=1 Tax=Thiocapsa imhoffii TaxID=382777 RepID=A0A9X0WJR5_9GAMM|nr:aminotransferase class I/II-fold pyridoxal phosphate-dependent enzyme [Thiocapsa imhoffii]MBK1645765.1 aminotransferase [Thiocapsa imhoffii]